MVTGIALALTSLALSGAEPEPQYRSRVGNNILAQQLVDEAVIAHPTVFHFYLHAIPPGGKDSQIIAQVGARPFIGKATGDVEGTVAKLDQILLGYEPGYDKIPRYKVAGPLRDASGNIVGMILMSIRRPRLEVNPEDQAAAVKMGLKIIAEIGAKISNHDSLFNVVTVVPEVVAK